MITARCGKTKSNKGKLFNKDSLQFHERDCPRCNPTIVDNLVDVIVTSEESDGVYFAIRNELYGGW